MDLPRELIKRGPFTLIDFKEAQERWQVFRLDHNAQGHPALLTDPDGNAKFAKTKAEVYGLALAQARTSLVTNVCPYSTPECRKGCVSYAGMGVFKNVQAGRIRKTGFLKRDPEAFLTLLTREIEKVWTKHGLNARIRLNTFSDISWELVHPDLFKIAPRLKYYDYTKVPLDVRNPNVPKNYRLTYSASEKTTDEEITNMLQVGRNVAIVFDVKRHVDLPKLHLGYRVVDGDKSDDRYIDPRGVVIGLRSKGLMRKQGGKMPRKVLVNA